MILTSAPIGKDFQIAKISGRNEVDSHLASLGFVEGANVSVVNELDECNHPCEKYAYCIR